MEIDRAPSTCPCVSVLPHARVCGSEQELGVASLEVSDGGVYVFEREVDEAVPTQDHINPRHYIADNIQDGETPTFAPVYPAALCDKLRHHISPYVFNTSQINELHPVKISAGSVKQRFGTDAFEQDGQGAPNHICAC